MKKIKMIVSALALGVATVVGAAEISHVSDGKLIEDQKNALIDKEEEMQKEKEEQMKMVRDLFLE